MSEESKEREILMVMRKVLSSVIREITPEPGMRHPLTDKTVEDVRMCLGLISSRERELADAAGIEQTRPYYSDQKRPVEVVPISSIGKADKQKDEKG